MALDHWLSFAAAAAILLAIPGPTVLLVVSYAIGQGRRRPAAALVAGVTLGDLTAMTLSMFGLGALLTSSAMLFTVARLLGAAYLVYLGVKLWRAPIVPPADGDAANVGTWRMAAHAWLVTTLNPKAIVFFVAFVPQFLDAARPFWPQVAVMEATFVALSMVNALGYVCLASSARKALHTPRAMRRVNRTGGSLLIGTGLLAAAWRTANA